MNVMRKNVKKIFALTIVSLLIFSLCACGDKKEETKEATEDGQTQVETMTIKSTEEGQTKEDILEGEIKSWGSISAFVPNGMTIQEGTLTNEKDENSFFIYPDEGGMSYIQVRLVEESDAKDEISGAEEYSTNGSSESIEGMETGDNKWDGVRISEGSTDITIIRSKIKGKCVLVTLGGMNPESPEIIAILSGIEIK